MDQRLAEISELRSCPDPGFSLARGTEDARLLQLNGQPLWSGTASKTSALAAAKASCGDWNIDALPRNTGCCSRGRNLAAMNQQVAVIDLRKSQLSPTSAAVLCHFISASSRTRGDADWRLGGT